MLALHSLLYHCRVSYTLFSQLRPKPAKSPRQSSDPRSMPAHDHRLGTFSRSPGDMLPRKRAYRSQRCSLLVPTVRINHDSMRGWENPSARLYYSYMQNVRPLGSTLDLGFLFTLWSKPNRLVTRVTSLSHSRTHVLTAPSQRSSSAQRSMLALHDVAPDAEYPSSIKEQCPHHVSRPPEFLSRPLVHH